MYKCLDCGNIFEMGEFEQEKTIGEYFGKPIMLTVSVCPCCKSDNYDKVYCCKRCGRFELDDKTFDGFCERCTTQLDKRFQNLINANFTKEERDLLNSLYEGECF